MAVVFEATIKVDDKEDKWYIQIKDTIDNRVETCYSIDEFSKKIEEMGEEYGGHVDEVKWLKDDDVPEIFMDDIRFQMSSYQDGIIDK